MLLWPLSAALHYIDAGPRTRTEPENALPKPPNYKQDKKRREEMQKRKNQEEQLRKAARKSKMPNGPDSPQS